MALSVMHQSHLAVTEQKLEKLTYTITEAAVLLGVGRSAAYEAARTGQLPTVRVGKRILVPREALRQFLAAIPIKSGRS